MEPSGFAVLVDGYSAMCRADAWLNGLRSDYFSSWRTHCECGNCRQKPGD